jgi:hypothetical protein
MEPARAHGVGLDQEHRMSKETPKDDPRQAKDSKNTKQTDQPWKGPVEKKQKRTGPPPDL